MGVIETTSLSKSYSNTTAVDGLDLSVEQGEVFGFLGPNGSGKSTTIDILLGFIQRTSGTASVFGLDPAEDGTSIRRNCGVVPDGFEVMPGWTGRDHLAFELDARDVDSETTPLLDRVGLLEDADRPATEYSRGMTQRLLIAMACAGEPDVLLLDEPSTGLDPNGAQLLQELVEEQTARGATVFFSSHRLGQVESVCDRIGILADGSLLTVDSIESLRETLSDAAQLRVSVDHVPNELEPLLNHNAVNGVEVDGCTLHIECSVERQLAVLKQLEQLGVNPREFETETASLQDVFAAYTTSAAAES
ncbi:ABC transporter ATP-binding protein [Halobacterium salinarum]|uniref:ABC transporter ATP-binding protein n=1 Tax=Halobacterium salinarum TaxID=2242 RepID=UPI002285EE66|nr:ABC transporter ATP-binding protein [Halobacterium salinarum]MCF2240128.1 ABC transporter ATP-binding protein [Halobacterium salinarum]